MRYNKQITIMTKLIRHICILIMATALMVPMVFIFSDNMLYQGFTVIYAYTLYFVSRSEAGHAFIREIKRSMLYLGIVRREDVDDSF